MFKLVGLLVALYAFYAAMRGEVFAKAGGWGRTISRQDSPIDFWMTIVIYAGLAVALATVF
jgi:hypothetical protein